MGWKMGLEEIIKLESILDLEFKTWEHTLSQKDAEVSLAYLPNTLAFFGGGIYRMYDASGEIIYVGKSNDIHRRLLQHIGKRTNSKYFIEEATKTEYHVNNDPVFQTLLEGIFIALHTPKYNDEVKDRRKSE